jgi:hypothetical protein
MDLNLFSSCGKDGIRNLLEACRPCLEGKQDPLVAYLPAGSLSAAFDDLAKKTFRGLAGSRSCRRS